MNCSESFADYLVKCNEEIQVYAQLAPLSTYEWVITDKFNNKFSGSFTTDADGFWSLDVNELPSGLLTQYSGTFELQVMDVGCKPINFKVAQEYNSIRFTIKPGTMEKNSLGCNFSCIGRTGAQSELIPFTAASEIEIDWTTERATNYGNAPLVQVYHLLEDETYQLASVTIQQNYVNDLLSTITVVNGGPATGYILIR